ncbi:hypothetical protein EVAR_88962_1 [Eumeta japonica]|uniref:Uncharacterized protein n=1 Tax=Eumeta variegata TaxID=151549 RepID=A0A4C1VQH7_EUMVA|nr:hypothetical protein EVAR_88962_1 [Eumeta japonica]
MGGDSSGPSWRRRGRDLSFGEMCMYTFRTPACAPKAAGCYDDACATIGPQLIVPPGKTTRDLFELGSREFACVRAMTIGERTPARREVEKPPVPLIGTNKHNTIVPATSARVMCNATERMAIIYASKLHASPSLKTAG